MSFDVHKQEEKDDSIDDLKIQTNEKTSSCVNQNATEVSEMKKTTQRISVHKAKRQTCAICLSKLSPPIAVLQCGHVFHESCDNNWFFQSDRCPVCREHMSVIPFWPCSKCSELISTLPLQKVKMIVNKIKEMKLEDNICVENSFQ